MSVAEVEGPRSVAMHGIHALREDVEAVLEHPSLEQVSSLLSLPISDEGSPWSLLDVFWGYGPDHEQGKRANIAFLLHPIEQNSNSDLLFLRPDAVGQHDCSLFPINAAEIVRLRATLSHQLIPPPLILDEEGTRLKAERKADFRVFPRRDQAFRTVIKTLQDPATPKINRGLGSSFSPLNKPPKPLV